MTNITVRATGAKRLNRTLLNISKRVSNFRTPFSLVAPKLVNFYQTEVFSSEGKATGANWDRLAKSTVKQRGGRSHPILKRTGTLAGGTKSKVSKNSLIISSTVKYYPFHQLGTSKMPQRIILLLDEQRVDWVIEAIQKYIAYSIRRR